METSILPTIPLLALSRVLKPSPKSFHHFLLRRHFLLPSATDLRHRTPTHHLLTAFRLHPLPLRGPLSPACFATSAGSGSGGGGDDGVDGGRGGGGGGGSSGGVEAKSIAVEGEDAAGFGDDVIVLDIGGMSCGGCAASVKRILESQPQVSTATVNLATETAVVWANPEFKVSTNWQQQLGEELAKHLTTCGFKSNIRDSAEDGLYKLFQKKMDEKKSQLRQSGRDLAMSWALCAVCLLGHASHFLGATAPSWIHALHSTGFHMSISLFTLLGPGRQLIVGGLKSLIKGSPNMNTLVGLGALSSFTVSSIAVILPKLGWKAFFEEPIMLIAFVLLGKNLEQRAKLKASSDMTGLLKILPSEARLVVGDDTNQESSFVEVQCSSLSIGDRIVVLPGDRVPADGVVQAGRSSVDESSLTGEPLPITKLPGTEVTAGSINLNGTITVEVKRAGGETVMADIIRLVEEAQAREAPVQRLADKVSGYFTYGVMAFSAATFMFWNTFTSQIVPSAFYQGSSVSLALQLSCSVLVVACPCALGLATPTAVLVGTSLGAKRGLLLRGGDVLEKFAGVDTVVFDKTGTLTAGRPIITKVLATKGMGYDSSQSSSSIYSVEEEILRLAAGVELNTNHPVGKAISEAARAAGCLNAKAVEGTFSEEPGSGATAIVEQKKVTVGTMDWLERHGVDHQPLPDMEEFRNHSVVYVGVDNTLAGVIYFEDKIREDASHVVRSLVERGIGVYMLSGDKKSTAEYVATMVGINKGNVLSGVKPNEKKKFVCDLQNEEKRVAMVGDGINDAAALASAHVGIAMGQGVGAASDVSSIVLMGNKLSQLLEALELSRLTMKTVKQNLFWAFAYNIVGIPVAAGLLLPITGTMLTPSIAGGLMGLSSVGVMANSLLLRLKLSSKQKAVLKLQEEARAKPVLDFVLDFGKPPGTKWRKT